MFCYYSSSSRRAYARGQSDPSVNDLWKNVQTRYGPLDLAFIPVWAGKPEATSFLKKVGTISILTQVLDTGLILFNLVRIDLLEQDRKPDTGLLTYRSCRHASIITKQSKHRNDTWAQSTDYRISVR